MNLDIGGYSAIVDPPVVSAPSDAYSLTLTASAAAPLVWVATLPDWRVLNRAAWVSAALISRPGRVRWQEHLKLMRVFDWQYGVPTLFFADKLLDRFGTIQEGQRIAVRFQIMDTLNGLIGAPHLIEGVVSA